MTTFVRTVGHLDLRWMLVGSAATAVHGVVGIAPGDVDVLVHPDTDDAVLAEVARRLSRLPACDQAPPGDDLDTFVSTERQPLIHSGAWTFGRWHVEGTKLEMARIREHLDDGPLETHGRPAWAHVRTLTWEGLAVPTVPLEIQWATIVTRGQADRLDAVARAFDRGRLPWEAELARAALFARGLDPDRHSSGSLGCRTLAKTHSDPAPGTDR